MVGAVTAFLAAALALSDAQAGLHSSAMAVGMIAASLFSHRLDHRFGIRAVHFAGLAVSLLACPAHGLGAGLRRDAGGGRRRGPRLRAAPGPRQRGRLGQRRGPRPHPADPLDLRLDAALGHGARRHRPGHRGRGGLAARRRPALPARRHRCLGHPQPGRSSARHGRPSRAACPASSGCPGCSPSSSSAWSSASSSGPARSWSARPASRWPTPR